MKLLIYGSREFADTVEDLACDCGYEVAGRIDDFAERSNVFRSLAEGLAHCPHAGVVLGVGYRDLPARWRLWERLRAGGVRAPALVHPRAYVGRGVEIGDGALVMATACIDRRARVGEAAVVWPGACVSHDSVIGENSFVSPNATICGFARVGPHGFVGAGAAVADRCVVPPHARLKMLERYALHRDIP